MKPVQDKGILSRKEFSSIFGDIEPILTLNRTLYSELVCQKCVGSAFCKIAPYLKLYSAYAHDYEIALQVVQVFFYFDNFWHITKHINIFSTIPELEEEQQRV